MLLPIRNLFKRAARRLINKPSPGKQVVFLSPETPSKGNVLLSYILEPFLLKDIRTLPDSHTHYWESYQMAQTFLQLGYSVDVISYKNFTFQPTKKYDFFISARTNLETISKRLPNDCINVAHLDTAHWTTSNCNAYKRLEDLKHRRNISLSNAKFIEINNAIECADLGTILGNKFTIDTYAYAGKPIHRIPISTTGTYPWPKKKSFSNCRKNFVWFGSSGFVHKGLDLVLEAFAAMPDYNLIVCGPFDEEKKFIDVFHKELFETPNITPFGWVDVNSESFVDICNNSIALIYPTCSEGGGGSAITCMHAGLIPILSYEASVDTQDAGFILENCSIDSIQRTVKHVSNLAPETLNTLAKNAWRYAREHHSKESFAREYKKFVEKTLFDFKR